MHRALDPVVSNGIPGKTSAVTKAGTEGSVSKQSGSGTHHFRNKSNDNLHDFGKIPVFPLDRDPFFPSIKFSSPQDANEQAAKQTEQKLPETSHLDKHTFTEGGKNQGTTKLSKTAQQFYQPVVGPAVNRAKLHIGGRADELGRLSKANAITYGDDVFIPKRKYAPESVKGRALIGHELTHVAQHQPNQPQLFRDDEEPHYPTIEEQRKIEKALGRERKPKKPDKTADDESTPELELEEGKNLTPEEREKLAEELKEPLRNTIDSLVAEAEAAERTNPSKIYSEDELYDLATKAHKEIYEEFGKYISRKVTLTRTDTSSEERKKKDEILVKFSDMSNAAHALARTLATSHCTTCRSKLNGLNSESKRAVVNKMASTAVKERGEFLKKAAKLKVGGSYNHESRSITLPYSGNDVYHSAVHELIHSLAHPAFRAAFGDEDLPNEGFTEYFARQVTPGSSYPEPVSRVQKVKSAMSGPFLADYGTGGSVEESLRLAYFSGRLELIGWQPTSEEEEKAVEDAGGSKKWDPKKAKELAETYKQNAQEKQDTHSNILGVGVYFEPGAGTDPTFTVRYTRVLLQSQPYSKGRLLLEGQFMGTPVEDPFRLGGSIGIAGEYQEPFFYVGGGMRVVGSATVQGDDERVDLSPFAGIGIRPWQRVRVGAEGFVLFPVTGQQIVPGGGLTIGIEL